MKKRALNIFLALALCLTLLPTVALADVGGTTAHKHTVCCAVNNACADPKHSDEEDGHEEITWQEWTAENSLPSTTGYYYLTKNVTISSMWKIDMGTNIVLCLNGKTLTVDNSSKGDLILIEGTLTITDCGTTGKITSTNTSNSDNHKVIVVSALYEDCTFNLYGGTITGINAGDGTGGGVHNEGTFNMYGGTITNNKAKSGGGVSIYRNGSHPGPGIFNMYGGIIKNNTASDNGGGVYNYRYDSGTGVINLYDGTIEDNTATNEGDDVYNDDNGTLNANGGTIAGEVFNYGTLTVDEGSTNTEDATVFKGTVTNKPGATISGGLFNGAVENQATGREDEDYGAANAGTISGGTFNGTVTNLGTIRNGIFNGKVTNNHYCEMSGKDIAIYVIGKIYDGKFFGTVEGDGNIHDGQFYNVVSGFNCIVGGTFYESVTIPDGHRIEGGVFYKDVDASGAAYILGGTVYGTIGENVSFDAVDYEGDSISAERYTVNFYESKSDIGTSGKVLRKATVVGNSSLGEPYPEITIEKNGATYVGDGWYYKNDDNDARFYFENDSYKVSSYADRENVLNLFLTEDSMLYKVLTIEVPFTIAVKQGGGDTPPAETFALELVYSNSERTTLSEQYKVEGLSVDTNGTGSYTGTLKFTGTNYDLNTALPGLIIKQKQGTAENWTYAKEIYQISLNGMYQPNGTFELIPLDQSNGGGLAADGNINNVFVVSTAWTIYEAEWSDKEDSYITKMKDNNPVVATKMTFTNTYTAGSAPTPNMTRYTITATAGTGGTISPAGSARVTRGSDKVYTIAASEGYEISDVLVDGVSVGAVTHYTFENVRMNHSISVSFVKSTGVPDGLNGKDHGAYINGYPDGMVHPNESTTRAETAAMLYRLLTDARRAEIETDAHDFTDIPENAWYRTAVATLANGGYITGYSDGRFGGNDKITRAQFVTMLARFVELEKVDCSFSDLETSHWAYGYIANAAKNGWVTGDASGAFRPDEEITRAEAMAIINRVLDRGVNSESALLDFKQWTDNDPGAWYYYEVIEATNGHDYTGKRPSEDWIALR